MMGSGGFIVLDERPMHFVKHTMTLAHFYNHESCGQCTPSPREGTGWMYKIFEKIESGKEK